MKKLILLIMILASGCAHLQKKDFNKSWAGRSQQEVITQLGPPHTTFKDAAGNEYYTYIYKGPVVTQSQVKAWSFTGERELVTSQAECRMIFAFASTVVSNVNAQGQC